jgi:hypothetical protein
LETGKGNSFKRTSNDNTSIMPPKKLMKQDVGNGDTQFERAFSSSEDEEAYETEEDDDYEESEEDASAEEEEEAPAPTQAPSPLKPVDYRTSRKKRPVAVVAPLPRVDAAAPTTKKPAAGRQRKTAAVADKEPPKVEPLRVRKKPASSGEYEIKYDDKTLAVDLSTAQHRFLRTKMSLDER